MHCAGVHRSSQDQGNSDRPDRAHEAFFVLPSDWGFYCGLTGSKGTIYSGNLFRDNNSGGAQVNPGSATEVGENFCQLNTTCP